MMPFNNPQDMTLVGVKTPQTVVFKSESHKLHQAFVVKEGSVIIQGQPVKLNDDGTIEGYTGEGHYLGIAMTDSVYPCYPGSEVTVAVEGFAIVYGIANGTIKCGPVVPAELPTKDSRYVKYNQGIDTTFMAINTAEAGDLIQVLVK